MGMVDIIREKTGRKYLLGSVCPEANGSTESVRLMIKAGFQLYKLHEGLIFFRR